MQEKRRESIPDLSKDSPEYRAHVVVIQDLFRIAREKLSTLQRVLGHTKNRLLKRESHGSLPPLASIDRETHINCAGLQILFHHIAVECFRREYDDCTEADLRPFIQRIASTRLSVANFAATKQVFDNTKVIEKLDRDIADAAGLEVEVPSITPYLFNSQTANSQLKKILGSSKFKNSEVLLGVGELFSNDHHVLHSVCMSLIQDGMYDHVKMVLEDRAKQLYPDFGACAIIPLFQADSDLFTVYVISLVEGGKTNDALNLCDRALFKDRIFTSAKLAEKYATALRHQRRFEEARKFLRCVQDEHGLQSKELSMQYNMALSDNPSILVKPIY